MPKQKKSRSGYPAWICGLCAVSVGVVQYEGDDWRKEHCGWCAAPDVACTRPINVGYPKPCSVIYSQDELQSGALTVKIAP